MIRINFSYSMRSANILICLISLIHAISGQETGRMVASTPDYRFRDGIFMSFEMLKANTPVPKQALLIADDYNDPDFFRRILTAGEIRYRDESGTVKVISREMVFAFSAGGELSIMYRGRFSREVLTGSISLFTFSKKRYYRGYHGYISEENPGSADSKQPGSDVKDYERIKYHGSNTCLLDFTTGRVIRLNIRNLELLLSADKSVYEDYRSLSKRWRKAQMFYFMGKFNEKNPLYLPEY